MHKKDIGTVSELALLANPHAVEEKYREHIVDELEENPDLAFVAVDKDRVVGYVQGDTRGSKTTLEDIAVAREYQGKGVGQELLKTELTALKKRGVKMVFAEVHYKNAGAIPFYYKNRFRISGFLQDYFGEGDDAIILKLVLQEHSDF